MEQAIKKAILDGGYRSRGGFYKTPQEDLNFALNDYDSPEWHEYCLDPLFWQALGKALGWGNTEGIDERTFWSGTIDYPEISDEGQAYREIWRWNMHRFIDHLAEGKDAVSFFHQLLTDRV